MSILNNKLKKFALQAGHFYLGKALDKYIHPYYEARRQALVTPEQEEIAEVINNPDLKIMRDKVSDILEEALSKIIWKPRMRDEDGGQEPVEDYEEEFIIMQMMPVVIVETGTYTIMVRVSEKQSKLERDTMSLSQFLGNFIPMKELTFNDSNA